MCMTLSSLISYVYSCSASYRISGDEGDVTIQSPRCNSWSFLHVPLFRSALQTLSRSQFCMGLRVAAFDALVVIKSPMYGLRIRGSRLVKTSISSFSFPQSLLTITEANTPPLHKRQLGWRGTLLSTWWFAASRAYALRRPIMPFFLSFQNSNTTALCIPLTRPLHRPAALLASRSFAEALVCMPGGTAGKHRDDGNQGIINPLIARPYQVRRKRNLPQATSVMAKSDTRDSSTDPAELIQAQGAMVVSDNNCCVELREVIRKIDKGPRPSRKRKQSWRLLFSLQSRSVTQRQLTDFTRTSQRLGQHVEWLFLFESQKARICTFYHLNTTRTVLVIVPILSSRGHHTSGRVTMAVSYLRSAAARRPSAAALFASSISTL